MAQTSERKNPEERPTTNVLRFLRSALKVNAEIKTGLVVFVILMVVGIGGLAIIPSSVLGTVNLADKLAPLSRAHPLGTDVYGRDDLKIIILAIPYDVSIALLIVIISAAIGILVGTFAGYRGGVLEEIVMRITDIFFAFPAFILAIAVGSVIGRSYWGLVFTLLTIQWTSYLRLSRGQVVLEKQKPYVTALRKLGIPSRQIVFRHLIRNTMFPALVNATLNLANVILLIAGLSFLGLGGGALSPDWGTMIAQGIGYFLTSPWPVVFPGIAIIVIALAFNLVGDGLRDLLDPRLGLRI
jgi:peptide/nickel transport system permease protein